MYNDYLNFVYDVLCLKWDLQETVIVKEKELKAVIELFAAIAIYEALGPLPSSTQIAFSTEEGLTEEGKKIKEAIEFHADRILKICKTGFPFSSMPVKEGQWALFQALRIKNSDFFHYMMQAYPQYMFRALNTVSKDFWKKKEKTIVEFLRGYPQIRHQIAQELKLSADGATSAIGAHLVDALTAGSYADAIPHFNALAARLPKMSSDDFMIIFNRPYNRLCQRNFFNKSNPDFVKQLALGTGNSSFFLKNAVFVFEEILITLYDPRYLSRYMVNWQMNTPPHLMAYDLNTENLLWSLPLFNEPLEPRKYTLAKSGNYILYHLKKEKFAYLINSKTGKIEYTFNVPEKPSSYLSSFYLAPEGYGYQYLRESLIAGKVSESGWTTTYRTEEPEEIGGKFIPLSTHAGLLNDNDKELTVFGPHNQTAVVIQNCLSAQALEDKLFLIEEDSGNDDARLLRVRSLKSDDFPIENEYRIHGKSLQIGKVLSENRCVLFQKSGESLFPIFADLEEGKVHYSPYAVSEQRFITDHSEIYSWDKGSQELKRVTIDGEEFLGRISESSVDMRHVDAEGNLYYI